MVNFFCLIYRKWRWFIRFVISKHCSVIPKTKAQIDELNTEIDELEVSDVYKDIQSINDKDEYFSEIKVQLVEESERLETELNQIKDIEVEDDFQASNQAFFNKYQ